MKKTESSANYSDLSYNKSIRQQSGQCALTETKENPSLPEADSCPGLDYIYADNRNILYAIKQEMKTNSKLSNLVHEFFVENDDFTRLKLVEDILICFAGAENIQVNSTGNCINAKYLFVLEKLDNLLLISFSRKNRGRACSEIEASELVNKAFENLKIQIYAKLLRQNRNFLNGI